MGVREGGREGGRENQQAGIKASQSGSEGPPESRVEGKRERVQVCVRRGKDIKAARETRGKQPCGSNGVLDNGGAVGLCGASCGSTV